MHEFVNVVERNPQDVQTLRLPEFFEGLRDYVATGVADEDVLDLREAWQYIDSDGPVAGALPHSMARLNESPRRWRPPLTPRELFEYAECAVAGDVGYRRTARANQEFFEGREALAKRYKNNPCGRPTATGTACVGWPVWMPEEDGGPVLGFGCWNHLTEDEEAKVIRAYEGATADVDCRGCTATAGHKCRTDEPAQLRLVDGEWARKRSYRRRVVHDVRLIDWARAQ